MIDRNRYLNELISSRKNGFPKIITGIRRCGKSYLLEKIYKEHLISTGVEESDILMIKLDEMDNRKLRNPIELNEYVKKYCEGKKLCYVFIDEIQMVYNITDPLFTDGEIKIAKTVDETTLTYADTVLGLSRQPNIDLYVTGSNSKMLSSDIITQLRDKTTQISLYPLSFEEYYCYVGGTEEKALSGYLKYGCMPLAVTQETEELRKKYLTNLFKTTYTGDIIERNNLRKSEILEELCDVLGSASGELLNSRKSQTRLPP